MKNYLFSCVSLLCAASPLHAEVFAPAPSPNPWTDDYSSVASMDHWKDWGTYNVHDPSCKKIGDSYYMYSTDAIFRENREEASRHNVPLGFIQMRRSADLVNWEFLGWAFPEIPGEAVKWVRDSNGGKGAYNIWAPYIVECPDGSFRLYYCVSAFGKNTSCIGMSTADSPEGPWTDRGMVVKTDSSSAMNAIDPSVITAADGRMWMHYGSYFGGLYCVELNPATGFPITEGDQGHLVARRANYVKDNLEAPEIYHHQASGKYYLFQSYDPLMTTYNVRVGMSDKADGPFTDFHGKLVSDTTNNFPILTSPYKFGGHPGWVGTAHCGIFSDGKGNTFMAHQGRLASDVGMMDLHIRQVFFTPGGWPVVSPQRYAGVPPRTFSKDDLMGEWEIIRVMEPRAERELEAGQILWGEGDLRDGEWSPAGTLTLAEDSRCSSDMLPLSSGTMSASDGVWKFDNDTQTLSLSIGGETVSNLIIHAGHDWERETDTVLFTGLDKDGRSVWGKRVK